MEQTTESILITKDMTIGDVVKKYPACIEPLQAAGVHCVGCSVAYHETLDQGFKSHGMSEEEINKVIININNAIKDSTDENEGEKEIIITNKAAEKLKQILKDNHKEGGALRISVTPGGCSGFEYGLELDEHIKEDDKVFKDKGVKVVIPNENFKMLKGAKIDYVDSLQGAGFKITNPNASSSCGCGQSFA